MCSNEDLVKLYRETPSKRNKEILFNKIHQRLKKEAMAICHYYSYTICKSYRPDFFEEAEQESQVCLLKCIETFNEKKYTLFSTFYYICLKNYLSNVRKRYIEFISNEMVNTSVLEWQGEEADYEMDIEQSADNKMLYKTSDDIIEKLPFKRALHKQIFKDYVGFNDSKETDTFNFNYLSKVYNLSRTAIKKICDKYFDMLKDELIKSGDIDKVKQYL